MKTRLIETLHAHLPGVKEVTCITYSNPGSGLNARAQVLWFVFRGSENTPAFVAKTTRDPRAFPLLAQSYDNLVLLSKTDAGLFATPLHAEPDLIVETYMPGNRRTRWSHADREVFLRHYSGFQERARLPGEVDMASALNTLSRELLTSEESGVFLAACAKFFPTRSLPRYIQHGDLTRDNILFSPPAVHIVDYEHTHLTAVPGYDLYNLFSRLKEEDVCVRLQAYAQQLGFSYDDNHLALFPVLHELLEAKKKSGRIHTPVVYLKTLLSLLPL